MNEPIRAERATVRFFDGLEVDGYRLPSGEFRVGMTGASTVLGYSKSWLSQVHSSRPKTLKTLQGLGFTGSQLPVKVGRTDKSGASDSLTLSLDDFNTLILYAASKGKKAALALQKALTTVALNDFFRDAFDEPPLSIEEKRRLFYEAYAATISPEDWRNMDRQDILNLALTGDEPHLLWGLWNAWRED